MPPENERLSGHAVKASSSRKAVPPPLVPNAHVLRPPSRSYTSADPFDNYKTQTVQIMSMPDGESTMSDSEDSTMSDSEEGAMSDHQLESAISDEENDTSGPVFGPQIARAKLPHPLGKKIRLRVDLDGARGLPQMNTSSEGPEIRLSYSVELYSISHNGAYAHEESSTAEEGAKSLRGTVQWNEVLYLECFQLSFVDICVSSPNNDLLLATCVEVGELLKKSELSLRAFGFDIIECTLCLSTSQVLDDIDEEDCDTHLSSNTRALNDDLHVGPKARHNAPTAETPKSLHTILCQLSSLAQAVDRLKVSVLVSQVYWIQYYTYATYDRSLNSKSSHPRANLLITSMVSTMNVILPVASTYLQQRVECAAGVLEELYRAAWIMFDLVKDGKSNVEYWSPEAELSRLTLIIVTPNPTIGAGSTSASSSRGTITKDALLFVLEAIVQSSNAFRPLKSAASELLYFATSAEMASSNKKQVRDIYKRIDGLAAALQRGTLKGGPLTPEHQEAIRTLAEDIAVLNDELNEIIAERKSRFKRFFAAKRHRNELQDVVTQLDNTRMNYMMAMATLNATTIADVHGHVRAITLVLNARPVLAPGARRADAVEMPFSASRIEEV
ncbi:hypothetical protein PENSPDRAFT_653231 [Peniophora sp. CONT]|nr:hypothetical protein PENSPDRAFT_653231 [Peniophora sp. CONT]